MVILFSLGRPGAPVLIALQGRGPVSTWFGVTVGEPACRGSVNHWANHRLESQRQKLEAERQGEAVQNATTGKAGTRGLRWFDPRITARQRDHLRQQISNTTRRASECRPVFE